MDVLGAMSEYGTLMHSKGYLRMAIASQIHEYSYNWRVTPLVLILSGFTLRIRSQRNRWRGRCHCRIIILQSYCGQNLLNQSCLGKLESSIRCWIHLDAKEFLNSPSFSHFPAILVSIIFEWLEHSIDILGIFGKPETIINITDIDDILGDNKQGSVLQAVNALASKPSFSLSYHILGASAWP